MKQIHSKLNWGAKTWSPKDDELLTELYLRRLPMIILVNNLQVSEQFIRDRVKILNLTRKRNHVFRIRGIIKWRFKLDPIKAKHIRRLHERGVPFDVLMVKYKVSRRTIIRAATGKIWKEKAYEDMS